MGRPPCLTHEEENEIVMVCDLFGEWKFGIGKREVVSVVAEYL